MVALSTRHIFKSSLYCPCFSGQLCCGAEGARCSIHKGIGQRSCWEAAKAVCASRDMAVAAVLCLAVSKFSLCELLTK